jgi:hypothetical protein
VVHNEFYASAAWTYKRVKEIRDGVELVAHVTELADITNPPPETKTVECHETEEVT